MLHTVVTRGRGHEGVASVASVPHQECQMVGIDMVDPAQEGGLGERR